MKRKFWIRLGVSLLIVLLLWWLYVTILVDEDEALALVECVALLDVHNWGAYMQKNREVFI